MTDADLCIAVLGWEGRGITDSWWQPLGKGEWELVSEKTPDFAHDIEWAMKLAKAAERKYECAFALYSFFDKNDGARRVYEVTFRDRGHPPTVVAMDVEIEVAFRAAIVKVVKAHEPKGESDG